MNKELMEALDILEKEKEISKDTLFEAIENSLMTACKNHFGKADNVKVEIDRETCDFVVYAEKEVVDQREDVLDDCLQICLEDAREISQKAQVGDILNVEIQSKEFGRIATQNAKNVILQKIREEERTVIYNQYYEKERDVIVNALKDEMKTETDAMQGVCFSYFIFNTSACSGYEYSDGQCVKSYSNKDGGGEVHMFLGDRFSLSKTDALWGHRFRLPETYDYSILRHLVRDCAVSAYNYKRKRELKSSVPGVQIVRELPVAEYTPDYHPTLLSADELQKIACVLSKEMAKCEEFTHSSVGVSQNQYDDSSLMV